MLLRGDNCHRLHLLHHRQQRLGCYLCFQYLQTRRYFPVMGLLMECYLSLQQYSSRHRHQNHHCLLCLNFHLMLLHHQQKQCRGTQMVTEMSHQQQKMKNRYCQNQM